MSCKLFLRNKLSAEAEIDVPPPAYDTLSIHRGVPSIPAISVTLAHDDEAAPTGRPSIAVTDVHDFEPPRRRLWARTLPRSRSNIDFTTQPHNHPVLPPAVVVKSLPECPQLDSRKVVHSESASSESSSQKRKPVKPEARKAKSGPSSWLSLLPFTSSKATKQVRQSVLMLIHDLVVPPPTSANPNPKSPQLAFPDPHEILASCAQSCSAKNLSLSTLLQEPAVAGHTAIYWAIVNYRPSLLDALLRHSSPLTPATQSEMRKACLVASNQALFQNLRLSAGLCASGLRSATDGLLLGQRPPDDVRIEEGPDGAFAATLDIALWQKRIRAVGIVSVEFIASGRIFALTFFTTDRPQPNSNSTKAKRVVGPLHVSLSLLEHSLPTYMNAAVVIDRPPPLPSPGSPSASPRKKRSCSPKGHIHSASFSGREKGYGFENGVGFGSCEAGKWDFNYDGQAHARLHSPPSSPISPSSPSSAASSGAYATTQTHTHKQVLLPPPLHPHRGLAQACSSPSLKQLSSYHSSHTLTSVLDSKAATLTPKRQLVKPRNPSLGSCASKNAPLVLRFNAGESMLAFRTINGVTSLAADPHALPHSTIKPDTWSEHGTCYVSAIVVQLGAQDGGGLMFDASPHIAPDGSLRARLEARLVKTEEGGKECIIC